MLTGCLYCILATMYIMFFCFFSYRACYTYEIVDDDCHVMDQAVDDILPFKIPGSNTTLYKIDTPILRTNLYPKNIVCFFIIGRR